MESVLDPLEAASRSISIQQDYQPLSGGNFDETQVRSTPWDGRAALRRRRTDGRTSDGDCLRNACVAKIDTYVHSPGKGTWWLSSTQIGDIWTTLSDQEQAEILQAIAKYF